MMVKLSKLDNFMNGVSGRKRKVFGITFAIITSFNTALGQVFLKYAALANTLYLQIFYYFISLVFLGFGFLTMMLSFKLIPISTAHPLLSIGFIFNLFFAKFLFNEYITLTKLLGIGMIIFGATQIIRD